MKFIILSFLLVFSAQAQTILLKDFNYSIPDIKPNHNKENLFQKMNRKLVRIQDSICSNRAHVWAYDFWKLEITSPKVFLFFTSKTTRFNGNSWWYHAAPMVNENGKLYVMDAGFPHRFNKPLATHEWLKLINGADSTCKEIRAEDDDLISLMFRGTIFPEKTRHGTYDCYFKVTPAGFWTPAQVAKNLLGKDQNGRPVRLNRDEFNKEEVFEACLEASTTPLGWTWGTTLGQCQYFVSH